MPKNNINTDIELTLTDTNYPKDICKTLKEVLNDQVFGACGDKVTDISLYHDKEDGVPCTIALTVNLVLKKEYTADTYQANRLFLRGAVVGALAALQFPFSAFTDDPEDETAENSGPLSPMVPLPQPVLDGWAPTATSTRHDAAYAFPHPLVPPEPTPRMFEPLVWAGRIVHTAGATEAPSETVAVSEDRVWTTPTGGTYAGNPGG